MFDFLFAQGDNLIQWQTVVKHLILIGIALVLSFPIAYNREHNSNSAGLRTYPLVAIATCSYTLLALDVLGAASMGKFMAGIVTGIGFIGGGAILKSEAKSKVSGLANAASIWNTGAIGMAVAWQRFEIAVIIATINFLILRLGFQAKQAICDDEKVNEDEETLDKGEG